jgi:hypothetical protein
MKSDIGKITGRMVGGNATSCTEDLLWRFDSGLSRCDIVK